MQITLVSKMQRLLRSARMLQMSDGKERKGMLRGRGTAFEIYPTARDCGSLPENVVLAQVTQISSPDLVRSLESIPPNGPYSVSRGWMKPSTWFPRSVRSFCGSGAPRFLVFGGTLESNP